MVSVNEVIAVAALLRQLMESTDEEALDNASGTFGRCHS